jgi:hypothetical protein
MNDRNRALLVLSLAAPIAGGGLVGCGPSPAPVDAGMSTPDAPMMMGLDSGMRRDAGPTDDSFDGAREVTTDGMAVMDAIEVANDRDFWRFEGTAGDWVAINTTANADDDPMMVDTVITLYDSTRTQIAENDDRIPRGDTDSEIVIRLPSTGTYYIEVQEFSTWMPEDPPAPEGMGSFQYELAVATLTDGGALNIDGEAGDDAASAQALRFGGTGNNLAFVLGAMSDATDVDVYSFSVATMQQLLSVDIMPAGPDGYGSTRPAGRIWVTDMAGATIAGRVEPRGMMQDDLSPTLVPGSYLLWVDAGGGTAGANDHYVLKALLGEENPREAETMPGANDMTATAEALTVTDNMGVLRGYILATLGASDVDIFSFDVPAGRQVNVFCGAQSSGSGVRGLSLQLLGPDGTSSLGMDTETATEGAAITEVMPAAAGTHYLRISASSQDPEVTASFVRCGVALVTPTAM